MNIFKKPNRSEQEASVMQRIFSVSVILSIMVLLIALIIYSFVVANNPVNGEYFAPFKIIRYVKMDANLGFDVSIINLLLSFTALTFFIYYMLRILYHVKTKKPVQ